MLKALGILTVLCFPFFLFSQSSVLTGTITDPENQPIELASVVLLNLKDSTVVSYSITDSKGYFKITEPKKGPLLFQASSLGFQPFYKTIQLDGKLIDLKNINLEEDLSTLDAVTISAVVPIQIKKDTIAYSASSFKVNYDDTIENLLGKLPGVEVDSDGKITAQGDEVSRIFVDGKEFFGGDPSIVLKNLSADAISKVEVIDKKSDQAELTGVDDGNKEVIINFTLKKNKKNQGFGKMSAGTGLDNRYFGNLNYNSFNPKTQFSVVGKFNNINITGSNIQGFLENADGVADDSDDNETNNTQQQRPLSGFLTTGVAGMHIGHEFKKNESFNADYFYNHNNNNGLSFSNRITFSGNNNFDYNSENDFDNTTDNHNFNFNYENKSNKMRSLRIKGGFTSDARINLLDRKGRFINDDNELITTNNIDLKNQNDRQTVNLNINYYQRLLKKGRNFGTGLNTRITDRTYNNLQNNLTIRNIGQTNESLREQLTLRDESIKNTQFSLFFNYTEPLWEKHYFKVQGTIANIIDTDDALQSRTTISNNNEEERLDFEFENTERRYSTRFLHNYNSGKWYLSYGTELQDLNRVFGAEGDVPITKNQFYLNPLATLQFKPKRGSKHRFSYRRIIKSPRTREITTVVNDLNPFSIRTGNPSLKTEKIDQFDLKNNIHDFKSSVSFYSNIQFQYIEDAIISNVIIDENFIRNRTYENGGNNKRLRTDLSLTKKIKKLGIRYTLKNKNLFQTSNALVNRELNDVTTQDYLFSLSFENSNKNKFDIKTGGSYGINKTAFSFVNDLDRTFTKQNYFASFDYAASKNFNANTQLDYIIFADNKFTNKQELPIWNAALSYAFSGNKSHILKLLLIDILNKNIDVFRRSTVNYFEETTTESLRRYIILSYTYKLNNGKQKKS